MKSLCRIFCILAGLLAVGCTGGSRMPDLPQSPVVVLFESDAHCAVDGYARMAALKAEQAAGTPYVTVVSSGDFVQGGVTGSVTRGESIIRIMNLVGYDLVALGNHEFDYGMPRLMEMARDLKAEELCANFTSLENDKPVFKPYSIINYGECDIAFIGIITPSTATSVSPNTFTDSSGNPAYSFNLKNLLPKTQYWIDHARKQGADYVVLLSHLGAVKDGDSPTSVELVKGITGIDVVLDGHSHSFIPDSIILDRKGSPVLLSSAGYGFAHIGKMVLSTDGKFSCEHFATGTLPADSTVAAFTEKVQREVLAAGEKVVGKIENDMPALDQEKNWLVRDRQMAIGAFCADAFRTVLGTDIAMVNGGGIRSGLEAGDITYNDLLSVFPFGNNACTVSLTGAQLLDILEVSVKYLPLSSGSFMQVSGLRYAVDTTVASPVVMGEDGLFHHIAQGAPRRISSVEVYDKSLGRYLPAVADKTYTLGGIDYNLIKLGSEGMFRYTTPLQTNLGLDVDILAAFVTSSSCTTR